MGDFAEGYGVLGMQQVDVEPRDPNIFFSASEDGTVRFFDKRMYACAESLCI